MTSQLQLKVASHHGSSDTDILCCADPSKLRYVKASNILGLLPRPFDRDTFPMTTRILEDAQGRQTFELPCQNTIRFRWVTLEDGSVAPQTNTRCASKPLNFDSK